MQDDFQEVALVLIIVLVVAAHLYSIKIANRGYDDADICFKKACRVMLVSTVQAVALAFALSFVCPYITPLVSILYIILYHKYQRDNLHYISLRYTLTMLAFTYLMILLFGAIIFYLHLLVFD